MFTRQTLCIAADDLPRLKRWIATFTIILLVVGGLQAVSLITRSSQALADANAATSTGGEFVSTQGRALDTRDGTGGYSTPMSPNTWRTVQIAGVAGVPTSGANAVQVTVTIGSPSSNATVDLAQYSSSPVAQHVLDARANNGNESNTSIVSLGAGKIEIRSSAAVYAIIDVQGYYTAGVTAAGGYVSVAPARIVDSRTGLGVAQGTVGSGTTKTITVSGSAGVPTDANAVFVNIGIINNGTGSGFIAPYPTGTNRPNISMNFPGTATTSFGTTVDLSSSGQFNIYVATPTDPVNIVVDVFGYFAATTSGVGVFTPGTATITSGLSLPSGQTTMVQIAGTQGVPSPTDGVTDVAMTMAATTSDIGGGYVTVWAPPSARPGTASLNMDYGTTGAVSNFLTTEVDQSGKVNIYNSGPANVALTLTVQGWYSTATSVVAHGVVASNASPVAGADVFLYLQPTDDTASAAAEGDEITSVVVGAAKTTDSGSFNINLPLAAVPSSYVDADGTVNFEVDIASATQEIDWPFSSATPTSSTQPWIYGGGSGEGAVALSVDLGAATAYDVSDDPANALTENEDEAGNAARSVYEDARMDTTDSVADDASTDTSDYPQYASNSTNVQGMSAAVALGGAPGHRPICHTKWGKWIYAVPEHFMNVYAFSGASGTVKEDKSSSHTLGIGLAADGKAFKASGSATIAFKQSVAKTGPGYANSTVWNRVNYRIQTKTCSVKKWSGTWRKPVSINEFLSSDYTYTGTHQYKYCSSRQSVGATTTTGTSRNYAFSGGVSVLGLSLSAQSGWTKGTSLSFKFTTAGYVCYTNPQGAYYSRGIDTQASN